MTDPFITAVRPPVPIRFLLSALTLLLVALLPAFPAAAQTCSKNPPAATVAVKTDKNTELTREERSFNELTRLFKKPGAHPAGLYTGAISVAQQARYRWTNDGREICVSVEAVEVTLTLTDPKIYIGRELADAANPSGSTRSCITGSIRMCWSASRPSSSAPSSSP
jgi:hypothetical protein